MRRLEIVDDASHVASSYTEEYTFDSRGRVTTVANNLGTYAFLGQSGRPSTVSLANGMQTQYDYFGSTGDFRLKQINNLSAGTTPSVISQFVYTHLPDRRIAIWKNTRGRARRPGPTVTTTPGSSSRQISAQRRRADHLSHVWLRRSGNRIQVADGVAVPNNYEKNNSISCSRNDFGTTTFAGSTDEPATVKVNGKPAMVMSTDGGAPFRFERQSTSMRNEQRRCWPGMAATTRQRRPKP